MKHDDIFKQDLNVGDYVVAPSTSSRKELMCFEILKLTPKMVRVRNVNWEQRQEGYWREQARKGNLRYPHEMCKVEPSLVTFYKLRGK